MVALYYLLRSRQSGQYLAARQPPSGSAAEAERYLLLFQKDFEAMSYINAHAPEMGEHFLVESHNLTQLKSSLERWGFTGVAFVTDPLEPQVDFMARRFL